MRSIIFLVVVISLLQKVYPNPFHLFDELREYRQACMQELGISDDVLKQLPGTPHEEIPKEIKCLVDCSLRKAGYVDANGALQVDKLPVLAQMEGVDLTQCTAIKDSDPCQQTFLIEKCIKDQLPKPTQ